MSMQRKALTDSTRINLGSSNWEQQCPSRFIFSAAPEPKKNSNLDKAVAARLCALELLKPEETIEALLTIAAAAPSCVIQSRHLWSHWLQFISVQVMIEKAFRSHTRWFVASAPSAHI